MKNILPITSLLLACGLAGCNPFWVVRPDSEDLVKKGWAKHACEHKQQEAIYCYGTLADKVCYSSPREGSENRLSGFYGPQP